MKKSAFLTLIFTLAAVLQVQAFWPFSSDDEKKPPRLSELLEPASLIIDEASDLASEGKISEAVAKYREAIDKIGEIERENANRAETPEFNSLKNKRAYVNAAIDSLLLAESQQKAKPVAISDTTELQKKYDEMKAARAAAKQAEFDKALKAKFGGETAEAQEELPKAKEEKVVEKKPRKVPTTRAERIAYATEDIRKGDYPSAELMIRDILNEKPNDAAGLNLLAVVQIGRKEFKAAEATLDCAIRSNPRDYYAYYNMARLMLKNGNRDAARRYYDTGRTFGGPVLKNLEGKLK